MYNNDMKWDLKMTQTRFNLVDSLEWTTTQTAGTTLAVYDVVRDLIKIQ